MGVKHEVLDEAAQDDGAVAIDREKLLEAAVVLPIDAEGDGQGVGGSSFGHALSPEAVLLLMMAPAEGGKGAVRVFPRLMAG